MDIKNLPQLDKSLLIGFAPGWYLIEMKDPWHVVKGPLESAEAVDAVRAQIEAARQSVEDARHAAAEAERIQKVKARPAGWLLRELDKMEAEGATKDEMLHRSFAMSDEREPTPAPKLVFDWAYGLVEPTP